MRKNLLRVFAAVLVGFMCSMTVSAQSSQNSGFPEGSTSGRTEMDRRMTGLDFPNITFSATAPRSGSEVAFSVQLLLLLTLLTLAPSILILTTCFLRFSIVSFKISSFFHSFKISCSFSQTSFLESSRNCLLIFSSLNIKKSSFNKGRFDNRGTTLIYIIMIYT